MGMMDNLNMFFGKDEPLALTTAAQTSEVQAWATFMGRGEPVYLIMTLVDVPTTDTITLTFQQTNDESGTWTTFSTQTFTGEALATGVVPLVLPASFNAEFIRATIQSTSAAGTVVMGVSSSYFTPYTTGLYINEGRQEF